MKLKLLHTPPLHPCPAGPHPPTGQLALARQPQYAWGSVAQYPTLASKVPVMSSIGQDAASSSTQELNSTCAYLIYFESLEYLIPRLLVWLALFALATTDGVLHKHIKRRGWQLHRGICVVIGGFVLQDILLVTYSIGKRRGSTSAAIENVCKSYIFFADLADSLFIVSSPFARLCSNWHTLPVYYP